MPADAVMIYLDFLSSRVGSRGVARSSALPRDGFRSTLLERLRADDFRFFLSSLWFSSGVECGFSAITSSASCFGFTAGVVASTLGSSATVCCPTEQLSAGNTEEAPHPFLVSCSTTSFFTRSKALFVESAICSEPPTPGVACSARLDCDELCGSELSLRDELLHVPCEDGGSS